MGSNCISSRSFLVFLLNFFQSQIFLDDRNAVLPDLLPAIVDFQLDHIVFTPYEVESVIKSLTIGKASGPNGVGYRVLRELSNQLASPFALSSVMHCILV